MKRIVQPSSIGQQFSYMLSVLLLFMVPTSMAGQRPRAGALAASAAQQSGGATPIDWNIPEPYASALDACAMYDQASAILFSGPDCMILPLDGRAPQAFQLAGIPGCPPVMAQAGIDAAVAWGQGQLLLFHGPNYAIYDLNTQSISGIQPWPLPDGWQWVDGAVEWGEGGLLLSYGLNSVVYDGNAYSAPSGLQWPGWSASWNDGVDDMLDPGDGFIYFFRGGEAMALSLVTGAIAGAPYAVSAMSAGAAPSNDAGRGPLGMDPYRGGQVIGNTSQPVQQQREPDPPAIVDAYLDNYPDFSDSVGVEWAAMNKNAMPGLDWLGVGLDIVTADPLRWTASPKKQNRAIATSISRSNVVGEPDKFLPYGSIYTTMAQGDGSDDETLITTMEEFHRDLGGTIGGSVGVPQLASFSTSATMRNAATTRIGSEVALITRSDVRKMFRLELMPTWTAEKDAYYQRAGQKYRQKLTPAFRAAVAKLRVPGSVPDFGVAQMTKNGKLPAEVESVRMEYNNLLFSYGNYFVEKIEFGGRYTENFELRKSEFMKSGQTFAAYASEASGVIRGIQVGANVAADITIGSTEQETSSRIKRVTQSDGYNGSKDWSSWDASTQNPSMKPVPVNISFLPIADLLTKEFFPDDPEIEKKHRILRMVTEQHLVNNAFDASGLGNANEWKSPNAGDAPRYYVVTFTKWVSDVDDAGADAEFFGSVAGGLIYGGAVVPGTETPLWSQPGRDDNHCTKVAERGGEYVMNITRTFCGNGGGFATGKLAIWGKMVESECTVAAATFNTNWDPASEPNDDHFTEVNPENAEEKGFVLPLSPLKVGAEPSTGKFTFSDGDSHVYWYYKIQRVRKEVLSDEDQKRCP